MERKRISSGSPFEKTYGYSRAVIDGDYVFVSGVTGYDYETMTMSEDVLEQAEQCFQTIQRVLTEAGSSLKQIVRVHYIVPKREDFHACAEVLGKYLGDIRPAATMFIAGLLEEGMKIEIEVTARYAFNVPQ